MVELLKEFLSSNIGQSLTIAAIVALASYLFTSRGRLIWSFTHQHFYQMPNPTAGGPSIPVRTQEIWIQNTGRAPIDNVEITLNHKPQHFEVWSPRKYTEETIANDRLILTFPSLGGRQFFRISLIEMRNNFDLPMVLSVKWARAEGRRVEMAPLRVYSTKFNVAAAVLLLIGATTVLYWLGKLALRIYNLGP